MNEKKEEENWLTRGREERVRGGVIEDMRMMKRKRKKEGYDQGALICLKKTKNVTAPLSASRNDG